MFMQQVRGQPGATPRQSKDCRGVLDASLPSPLFARKLGNVGWHARSDHTHSRTAVSHNPAGATVSSDPSPPAPSHAVAASSLLDGGIGSCASANVCGQLGYSLGSHPVAGEASQAQCLGGVTVCVASGEAREGDDKNRQGHARLSWRP